MVNPTIPEREAIAAKPALAVPIMAASIAAALAMVFAIVLALGAGAANAAGHSSEPSDLAERKVAAMASPAVATRQMSTAVSGALTTPEAGSLAGHELHFQERVSENLYTVRTKADGSFSTMLPQGVYDLRGMHGAVIVRGVTVGQSPVALGQVHPPHPYDVWRVFERQEVGEAIVRSPAPAAAHVPVPGETPQAVAVTPVVSPAVMGAGPGGKALAPAEVIPAQIEQQTELPSGTEAPAVGAPSPQDGVPSPSGDY